MTDREINEAIAEACGWVWYRIPKTPSETRVYRCLFHPSIHEIDQSPEWLVRADGTEGICNWEYMQRDGHVPDYCKDLNAVHSAVATLTRERYDADDGFTYHLARVVHQDPDEAGWNFYELQEATARQRAEAFIKTVCPEKWKEAAK